MEIHVIFATKKIPSPTEDFVFVFVLCENDTPQKTSKTFAKLPQTLLCAGQFLSHRLGRILMGYP